MTSNQVPTLREKAIQWMRDNPAAMHLFRRFAIEMHARRQPFGIGALTERVRWECMVTSAETPKINNSYRAYIARQLVQEMPGLADLIEARVTPAADRPARTPCAAQRVDPLTEQPMDPEDGQLATEG